MICYDVYWRTGPRASWILLNESLPTKDAATEYANRWQAFLKGGETKVVPVTTGEVIDMRSGRNE